MLATHRIKMPCNCNFRVVRNSIVIARHVSASAVAGGVRPASHWGEATSTCSAYASKRTLTATQQGLGGKFLGWICGSQPVGDNAVRSQEDPAVHYDWRRELSPIAQALARPRHAKFRRQRLAVEQPPAHGVPGVQDTGRRGPFGVLRSRIHRPPDAVSPAIAAYEPSPRPSHLVTPELHHLRSHLRL